MFEFNVGEKEIHKIKVSYGNYFQLYIDGIINKKYIPQTSPFAFEIGDKEKHFVFIQVWVTKGWSKSIFNFDVFIDNRFHGTYKFE